MIIRKKGVKFYYVYKSLAHPENNGYVPPVTLKERLMHIAEAKRQLGTRIHWICDSMDNKLKHALGDRPNSEFVIDPDGKIVVARQWSSPNDLRTDLERLVGAVRRTTSIAELGMKPPEPPKTAPKGIVPRLSLPSGMTPVVSQSISDDPDEPFYVKLRAEVSQDYFSTGYGKLYLGLFLDPLYQVHWNNQAMPVIYEIESVDGVVAMSEQGEGPEVKVKADADPREFLLDLCSETRSQESAEITIKIKYFACDDAETFCKPVSQTYRITLERDRDGGSRRSSRGRGGRQPGSFGRPPGSDRRGNNRSRQNLRLMR